MILDGKKITADYLRTHAAVAALDARVVGKTPDNTATPWVRVTQLDAQNASSTAVEHLLNYMLQLDCFVAAGEGQPQARVLAHTVRQALWEMQGTQAGVSVSATRIVNEAELYDTNLEPSRDYVALTCEVMIHS